ncbi:hypothetical protein OEZ85_008828 [Tetradesmus obliquus]|uniref:Vacuolar protein sorting-associated protein 8 central domain-containing protein n=1 Tax=Tetradesmus obliquus TaxID=3088 RepID=A0ABY8TPM3_TETOB|nr:hypothetical protein OEZ85_008828 [Tetradesmus obliquus]
MEERPLEDILAELLAGGEATGEASTPDQAWQYEEMLFHGGLAAQQQQQQQQQQQRRAFQRLDPQARLSALLSDAKADWNPAGRPAASGGAMIGGGVLLKLESLAGLFAGAAGGSAGSGSSSGAAGGAAAAGVDWSQVLAAALAPHGPLQVVAASGQYLAVGTASGSALVFQLPQQGSAAAAQQGGGLAGHQNPAGGHGHSALPGGVAMWQLGEGLGVDAVTCLGFSVVAAAGDALWLAVGHGSGALTVWELQRRGPRQVAGIAQHGARITLASFLPSRATSLLLTGDARGRLCLHTFSSLLLRTNVSSKVLANGQYGPLLGISHLAPFTMPAPGAAAAGGCSSGGGAGGRGSSWSAGVQGFRGGTPPLSPKGLGPAGGADEAAWRALFEDGAWRVGDGVFCLLTPSHAYIARLKPQAQELLMLFSIPQPTSGPQAAVPTAAWLPHARKASAGYRVWSGGAAEDGSHTVTNGVSNSVSNAGGGMVVPVAVLALGWGSRLVMFDVPLIGDHVNLGDAGAADAAPSNALAAAAAAAGQLRRGGPGSFTTSRAAQRAQQALESLNPAAAAQVAGHFPLSISATWSGSTPAGQAEGTGQGSGSGGGLGGNPAAAEPLLGPTEPLPILGVHWLDADAVAVVCQQGFSTLLLVLGFTSSSSSSSSSRHDNKQQQQQQQGAQRVLRVQEQVEWMDQPVDRQWALAGGLAAWGADCCCSVVGGGPRLYLLGQAGGVFCARLMPWSERLKTLQDVRKFKLGLYYALRFHNTIQQQQRSSHSGSDPHGPSDVLFARVYPLFARPPAAAAAAGPGSGSVAAFMGALEAAVLSDLLLGLDPEVMQALVQHFAAVGQPERVEGCVLHLSIASLDLDQVIRLCEGCGLYSALAYIHNSALADYRKPLTDLLAAVAGAGSAAEARRCCYKLLVYLRCCFRGLAFPPGTGSLPSSPPGVRDSIRATLLGSLLFADAADLLAEWRHSGGRAAAAAAALSAPPAATSSSTDASSSTDHSPVVCRRLSDPHPALQLLLSVDVPAVVAVLAEATAGWDAVETDLRAAAGKPASELESVLVATQVVVNALIALLEAGKFEQWQGSSSSSSSSQLSGGCVVMNYIADLLAAGRSHQHYNVAAATKACAAGGVSDAEAFLHERLALAGCIAHELFSLLLDEVVAVMADCLPLLDIVARVLTQHGSERFGEFRATLLGLFGATAYESAIMQAANRLITSDAFSAVRRSYLLRQLARQPLHDEEQQQGDGRGLLPSSSSSASAGPSTSAAAAAAAAAANPPIPDPAAHDSSSSSSAHMVQTALLLGVLGRGSSSSSSRGQEQQQQLRSLTQSDKDLISGILGPGGIKLQLQPAGPAAGHLSGIAAEYRKAAVAAHSSGHVYRGEVDLARELAALNAHSSHNSAAWVQQHGGAGAGTDVSSVGSAGSSYGKGLLQAASPSSGRHAADVAGANASAATADEAVSPTGRGSFDVDELLAWSQNNM